MSGSVKVVVVGAAGAGKTTMVRSANRCEFEDKYVPTLGVEVTPFRLDSKPGVAMNVWDTSGDPRYAGLGPEAYAIQADAIVVLHRETVEGSAEWLELALKGAPRAQVTHVINRAGGAPAEGAAVVDAADRESVLALLNSLLWSLMS